MNTIRGHVSVWSTLYFKCIFLIIQCKLLLVMEYFTNVLLVLLLEQRIWILPSQRGWWGRKTLQWLSVRAVLSFRDGWNCSVFRCVFNMVLAWISPSQRTSINPTPVLLDYCCCYIWEPKLSHQLAPSLPVVLLLLLSCSLDILMSFPSLDWGQYTWAEGFFWNHDGWLPTQESHLAAVTFESSEHIKEVEQRWRGKLNTVFHL